MTVQIMLKPDLKFAKYNESHFSFKYRSMLHDPILIQVSLT